MNDWNRTEDGLPRDGEVVDIEAAGGARVDAVEFSAGRFWKAKRGSGGLTYPAIAWRSRAKPNPVKKDPVDA